VETSGAVGRKAAPAPGPVAQLVSDAVAVSQSFEVELP